MNNLEINKKFLLTIFAIAIFACLRIYAGYQFSLIYDLLSFQDLKIAIQTVFIILSLWLAVEVFRGWMEVRKAGYLADFNNRLRDRICRKVIHEPIDQIARTNSGEYSAWLIQDVQLLESKYAESVFVMIENVLVAVFGFYSLFLLHPSIGLITLLGTMVVALIPLFQEKSNQKLMDQLSNANEQYSKAVNNRLRFLETFLVFNKTTLFLKKNEEGSRQLEHSKISQKKKKIVITMEIELIFQVINIGIMCFTAFLAHAMAVGPGAILAVGNLAGTVFNSTNKFYYALTDYRSVIPLFRKYQWESKEEPKQQIREIRTIQCRDLSVYYGQRCILDRINLTIEQGDKIFIRGESGSGKSTLLRTLLGLNQNYFGAIEVNGFELAQIDLKSLYDQVSYIKQQDYLFNESLLYNITFQEEGNEEEVMALLKTVNLDSVVGALEKGLHTPIQELNNNFSGGQIQRFLIARALFQKKTFFLIDEGTSALDKENNRMIENLFLQNKTYTVIYVSHHIDQKQLVHFNKIIEIQNKMLVMK